MDFLDMDVHSAYDAKDLPMCTKCNSTAGYVNHSRGRCGESSDAAPLHLVENLQSLLARLALGSHCNLHQCVVLCFWGHTVGPSCNVSTCQ